MSSSAAPASSAPAAPAAAPAAAAPVLGRSGKKICCACPGALRAPRRAPPWRAARARHSRAAQRRSFNAPPPRSPRAPTDTKKLRDACVVGRGEAHCAAEIEAHKACLREDGFKVA